MSEQKSSKELAQTYFENDLGKCPKCGGSQINGETYDYETQSRVITCNDCGFELTELFGIVGVEIAGEEFERTAVLPDGVTPDDSEGLNIEQGQSIWLTIGNRSVNIEHDSGGIVVSVYELGKENDDPVLDGMVHEFDDPDYEEVWQPVDVRQMIEAGLTERDVYRDYFVAVGAHPGVTGWVAVPLISIKDPVFKD